MNNIRIFFCLLLILSLGSSMLFGCASLLTPSTPGEARAMGPEKQSEFMAPENYMSVYRKVLNQTRKCNRSILFFAEVAVDGDIYQDTKSGTVTVAYRGFGPRNDIYRVIDLSAINDNQTKVTAYYSVEPPDREGRILK